MSEEYTPLPKEKVGKCACGHSGDAQFSDHEDRVQFGHGACKLCDCEQFTWVGWIRDEEELI